MIRKVSVINLITICFFCLWGSPLFSQATFTVSSSAVTATDIGVTELTGQVILTVNSGTTAQAPLSVQYSALITNNSASEINVNGTGGLVGISLTPVLDRANNLVKIDVPAGGGAGSRIMINGVRVALAGQNYTNVTATITSTISNGNAILSGQQNVVVINSIQQPFTVDMSSIPISWKNGQVVNPGTFIVVTETYQTAFSDAVGQYGQTLPTELRIEPFPALPPGVTLTFAPSASAATGATFATADGQQVTVPRSDGTTSVVYQFQSGSLSSATIEAFRFFVTVGVKPPADTGTTTFQVTLLPIGIAVPNSKSPVVDIPRYFERQVPNDYDLVTGSASLAIPFQAESSGTYVGIALTNPAPYRVKVNLAAYDETGALISGSGITNPIDEIMPEMGQFAKLATDVFGANFNASVQGTIRVTGKTSLLPSFYLTGKTIGQALDGATADFSPMQNWIWPSVSHQDPSPSTLLVAFNPGATTASAVLRLYDSSGSLKATATQKILPGGTFILDALELFKNVDFNTLSGGYITGSSDLGLVVTESFGNSLDSNVLRGQVVIQRPRFTIAHFVIGGGYQTELNFVNTDSSVTGKLTLTAFDNKGSMLGGSPVNVSVLPGTQLIRTMDQFFPSISGSFTTGYIQVDVDPYYIGAFPAMAPISGSVRFTSGGSGSTALPLFLPGSSDFIYSHVAQDSGYFTGIAILNPNAASATVTLEAFTKDGASVGSLSTLLLPGQKLAKLLYELIPLSDGQTGGYVHIQSTLPVVSFSLFGTSDGKVLSAIPPQSID